MYRILINDEIENNKWEIFSKLSATTSWFQTYSCYEFYKKINFLEGFALALTKNDKIIALVCGYIIADGGLIKKFMSRRAIIPGGLIISEKCSNDELKLLLQELSNQTSKKAIYTEIRNYFDYSNYRDVFDEAGYKYKEHLNFHINTESIENCLKQLSSTKRRDIKQSLKQGAEIINTKKSEDIKEYFIILEDLYKSKIKTPLFPIEFFDNIVQKEDCQLFVIKYENRIIGGSLCVGSPQTILYEWFVCGLDGHFKNIYPSTLATWAAIEYAATNNFQYFDMMGAGKPTEGYGVRDFKAKFGGQLIENGRLLRINNQYLYKLGTTYIKYKKQK